MTSIIDTDYPHYYQPPEMIPNREYKNAFDDYMKIKELERSALVDPLTGCYNEKYLTKFIHENFDPQRHHLQLGFAYIDVNNLKKVNDTYGHQAGDELIKRSANYLRSTFRKGDIVVHLHGDEFVVICNNHGKKDNFDSYLPDAIKDRISSKPPESFTYNGKNIDYSVAVGVAVFDQEQDSNIFTTLERSDFLMQTNKAEMKAGR